MINPRSQANAHLAFYNPQTFPLTTRESDNFFCSLWTTEMQIKTETPCLPAQVLFVIYQEDCQPKSIVPDLHLPSSISPPGQFVVMTKTEVLA